MRHRGERQTGTNLIKLFCVTDDSKEGVQKLTQENQLVVRQVFNFKIGYFVIELEQDAWYKSSLIQNYIFQSTQTLQLLTKIIKTEIIYKSI